MFIVSVWNVLILCQRVVPGWYMQLQASPRYRSLVWMDSFLVITDAVRQPQETSHPCPLPEAGHSAACGWRHPKKSIMPVIASMPNRGRLNHDASMLPLNSTPQITITPRSRKLSLMKLFRRLTHLAPEPQCWECCVSYYSSEEKKTHSTHTLLKLGRYKRYSPGELDGKLYAFLSCTHE